MIQLTTKQREWMAAVVVSLVAVAVMGGALVVFRGAQESQRQRKVETREAETRRQHELDRRFRIVEQEPPTSKQTRGRTINGTEND